jgi:FixJ family two-component response regulator
VSENPPIIFVVDDEPAVCASLKRLVNSVGLEAQTFNSAQDFLHLQRPDRPGCVIVDVRLPGLSGLDLQQELLNAKIDLPIIFITGHGDIPMSVRAMKAGAIEFLTKPFRDQDLIDAIQHGIERHKAARQEVAKSKMFRALYDSLTPRQREVFPLVASGLLNKQIAAQLGTAEKTIKVHRGQVMHKMKADSLAHLIHIAETLGLSSAKS